VYGAAQGQEKRKTIHIYSFRGHKEKGGPTRIEEALVGVRKGGNLERRVTASSTYKGKEAAALVNVSRARKKKKKGAPRASLDLILSFIRRVEGKRGEGEKRLVLVGPERSSIASRKGGGKERNSQALSLLFKVREKEKEGPSAVGGPKPPLLPSTPSSRGGKRK